MLLGTVGLHVAMGQLRGRCTASEGVLEGLQGSLGGYRVSLGVLLGNTGRDIWALRELSVGCHEKGKGNLGESKGQPGGWKGILQERKGNPG